MRVRILVAAVALALSVGVAGARTGHGAGALPVRTASLTQDGQQLVFSVTLSHPFAPGALARDRRSVCLAIERPANGSVAGVLCLGSRLVYMPVSAAGRGVGRTIAATISRAGSSQLTASFLPSAIGRGYTDLRWQVVSARTAPPCASACTIWFPSKPVLARLHTPRVVGCVPSGAPLVYSGANSTRAIALTFDDGPWTDTPQFLDVLEREHVPATFFQIGRQIGTYGAAVDRRMLADGDMIGDHTWSHVNVSGAGPAAASQINQTAAAIRAVTGGFQPCLLRAPGGAVSGALASEARSLGFTTINWDVDPRDWARPGTAAIVANVIAHAHNGAIVIQHDGGGDRSQTLAALPQEISTLRAEGYRFVTVTALLGQRLLYK